MSNVSRLLSCTAQFFANSSASIFGSSAHISFEFYHDLPLVAETQAELSGFQDTVQQCKDFV
jgi:hypothetical protein